jgi:hypothetical protein
MTTDLELDAYKGKKGTIKVNKMNVGVDILDARVRFGHIDLLIRPLTGSGSQWTEHHKVTLAETPSYSETAF